MTNIEDVDYIDNNSENDQSNSMDDSLDKL